MFCPKCKAEYIEGIRLCPECNVELVAELPADPNPEFVKLVTVLISSDRTKILLAKGILENAEIKYYIKGQVLDNLYLIDSFLAPTEVQVREDDVEKAKEILQPLLLEKENSD